MLAISAPTAAAWLSRAIRSAALTLMATDRNGPKISYQALFVPATDASVDSASYHAFGNDGFLSREFMKYGWDRDAPREKTRNKP